MRENETRVAEALAKHFRTRFRSGEDPPDIYLEFDDGDVAVEISALAQRVTGDDGRSRPRRSDEEPSLRLADALNDELGPRIPPDRIVLLHLASPLANPHRAKIAARALLLELLQVADQAESHMATTTREGDLIKATLSPRDHARRKSIAAGVSHRGGGYNIFDTNREMLEESVATKGIKCAKALQNGDVWLALEADCFFADVDHMRMVMAQTEINNPFSKILLIGHDGSVAVIHEMPPIPAPDPE